MRVRVTSIVALAAAGCFLAPAWAQEEGSTPGAIANPGSYAGSMQLQQQERERDQQMQMQNQQMQQRLDQTYRQYAPGTGGGRGGGGGGGGGGPPAVDWWSKPPLPAAKNPLLGRWKQAAYKGYSDKEVGGLLPGTAGILNGSFAEACKSIFGSGVIAFTPDSLSWVAPDGHEEVLNHVAYRANGNDVIMLSRDPGAIPALIFGFPSHDHAQVAVFKCSMDRLGAQPPPRTAGAAPGSGSQAAAAAAPSGPANAVLRFQVGISGPGYLSPLPGIDIAVTPEDPEAALIKAGYGPGPGGSLNAKLAEDCRTAAACDRDYKTMTAHALGSVRTDAQGHAQTPQLAAGLYYILAVAAYQGRVILWRQPVNVASGANVVVTLDQTTGSYLK
jgi:hypothetical protein